MAFLEGREYSRSKDIHQRFGGQRQGGISTPSDQPYVFIFTGKSGEQHGYADGWRDDGVFLYTGEGQRGDMTFSRGNAAIRDHSGKGKELLLFEAQGKGKPVRFLGRFACQSWDIVRGPDTEGAERDCIRFHLVKLASEQRLDEELWPEALPQVSIQALRARAYDAAKPKPAQNWVEAGKSYWERSKAVRDYVLVRAGGRCELTGQPAPFVTKTGEPYLEVHHTRRLSDGGPDDPRYVAAISPTAHREIHHGANGETLNRELIEKLAKIEPEASDGA